MGITIEIEQVTDLIDKHNAIGRCLYPEQKILIDVSKTPEDTILQAFFHELVHWIFYLQGQKELQLNEGLVDMTGHLLYQAFKDAEYDEQTQGEYPFQVIKR